MDQKNRNAELVEQGRLLADAIYEDLTDERFYEAWSFLVQDRTYISLETFCLRLCGILAAQRNAMNQKGFDIVKQKGALQ